MTEIDDGELDKIYLRARYYSPVQGRFMTEDPVKDGLNWYSYCGGNPVNRIDPSGESWGVTTRDARDIVMKYGLKKTHLIEKTSDRARNNACNKAEIWGYKDSEGKLITWDNRVDAMRHFQWNAIMTREIGIDVAKYVGDRHEINGAKDVNKFIKEEHNSVRMRVGQATLMDLWNNSVGRTLGNDKNLQSMNYDDLFYYAEKNGLLITDAHNVFEFYGIKEYVDWSDWTVDIEYNISMETITVRKENLPDLTLKVGINDELR